MTPPLHLRVKVNWRLVWLAYWAPWPLNIWIEKRAIRLVSTGPSGQRPTGSNAHPVAEGRSAGDDKP